MTTSEKQLGPIGSYSGVPMTATEIAQDGAPSHLVWGEEIPAPRDLTSSEFFALVMKEAGLNVWPDLLTMRVTTFCSSRDEAQLLRTDGKRLCGGKASGWTTWVRSFNRRYLNGMTLESAKQQPLSIEQVGSDIATSVRKIAEAMRAEIRLAAEAAERAEEISKEGLPC
jgi:hypothetical protein